MSYNLQTTRDKSTVVMEAAALDFRDQGNRVLNTARELRSRGGPESFIRDAEKIAADLRVLETLAWHQVEKNPLNLWPIQKIYLKPSPPET